MTSLIVKPSNLRQFQVKVTEAYLMLNEMNKSDILTAMKLLLNLLERIGELLYTNSTDEPLPIPCMTTSPPPLRDYTPSVGTNGPTSAPNRLICRKRKNPVPTRYVQGSSLFQKPCSSIMSKYRTLSSKLTPPPSSHGSPGPVVGCQSTNDLDATSDSNTSAADLTHDGPKVKVEQPEDDDGATKDLPPSTSQQDDESYIHNNNSTTTPSYVHDNNNTAACLDLSQNSYSSSQLFTPESQSHNHQDQPVFPNQLFLPSHDGGAPNPDVYSLGESVTNRFPIPYQQDTTPPVPTSQPTSETAGHDNPPYPWMKKRKLEKYPGAFHNELHDDGRVNYKCGFCKKIVIFAEVFHRHLKSHVSKTANDCALCNINFAFRSNLFRHIRRYHIDYVCALCKVTFSKPKQLEQHLQLFHADRNAVVKEVSLR